MGILGAVAQMARRKHFKAFEAATMQPRQAQWEKLQQILKLQAETEYGKKYGFSHIQSIADYQKQVPIAPYPVLQPYLERMFQGEANLLTCEEVLFWGMTTGSSGPPKFTPITPAYRDEYQSVVHVFLYHNYRDHPRAFDGKVLYFSGSAEKTKAPTGIACGTMSGFNFTRLPKLLQKFYAVPYELTVIDHTWSFQYVLALLALQQNITMMIGITGAPIIGFFKAIEKEFDSLVDDIRFGTLHKDLLLTPEERRIVEAMHKPNPKRAQALESLKQQGQLDPKSLWPGLDLVICWKSSHAGGFIPELTQLLQDKVAIRDAIYSATEGWCNVPYSDSVIGGPLAISAHFYEFVPAESEDNHPILLSDELEVGKQYRILYTTSAGIYRYDIGDILEVVEMYHQTPTVRFVRKQGQTCNLVGELMTGDMVTQAVMNAAKALDIALPFYAAMPNQSHFPAYYDFLLELHPSDRHQAQKLGQVIEKELQAINCDYKASRGAEELGPIQVNLLAENSLETYTRAQVKRGGDAAQVKPLVLTSDPERLADLNVVEKVPVT